jgi:hypothetical protein
LFADLHKYADTPGEEVIGERLLRNKKSWSDSGGYQALGQPSRWILEVELKAGRKARSRSNGTNLGERLQKEGD